MDDIKNDWSIYDFSHKPILYKAQQYVSLFLADFKVLPKARARPYQTSKGRKSVYSPSSKNQSQLSFAWKKTTQTLGNGVIQPFLGNVGLFASVRARGVMRGDSDNYLKQIKDALQFEKFPIVENDKQIVFAHLEKVENFGQDCVLVILKSLEEKRRKNAAPFAFFSNAINSHILDEIFG